MKNNDISLTAILHETDRQIAKAKKQPRVVFTDHLDTSFWVLDSRLQISVRTITKRELKAMSNVYDDFSSPEIRDDVAAFMPNMKRQPNLRIRACSVRQGDSICLFRGRISFNNPVLISFTSIRREKVINTQLVDLESSPLIRSGTSFQKLRRQSDTPDRVFFTSDTHFSEERILQYRPRFTSTEEMDAYIVSRWNETVPEDGIVFHLGDFSETTIINISRIAGMLNGRIFLVPGNHDQLLQSMQSLREWKEVITVLDSQKIFQYKLFRIILNHYPLLCYPRCYTGNVWQLFGHLHTGSEVPGNDTSRMKYLLPYQYDVGVENNDYRPISLRQVMEIMERRKVMSEGSTPIA